MNRRAAYLQAGQAMIDLQGITVNSQVTDHTSAFLVGGVLFFVELAETSEPCPTCAQVKEWVEPRGAKWIRIEPDCPNIADVIGTAVHYSRAQTRCNLDATIDLWCDYAGVSLTHKQSQMLINLITPGGMPC